MVEGGCRQNIRKGESRVEEDEKEKKTNPPVFFHMNPVGSHKGRLPRVIPQ